MVSWTLRYFHAYLIIKPAAYLGESASWFDRHLTEWIQPEKLRAPEVILGAAWDHKVDIWNLGLIVCNLLHSEPNFDLFVTDWARNVASCGSWFKVNYVSTARQQPPRTTRQRLT